MVTLRSNKNTIKQGLDNPVLRLLVRVGLGVLFIVTGIDKILDPYGFKAAIEQYNVISGELALLAAIVFPWFEAVFGATLLLGVFPRSSALVLTGLLAIFIAAMFLAWGETLTTGCGCFPWESESVTVGWSLVSRDILVLLAGLYAWAFPSSWLALYPADVPGGRGPIRADTTD